LRNDFLRVIAYTSLKNSWPMTDRGIIEIATRDVAPAESPPAT